MGPGSLEKLDNLQMSFFKSRISEVQVSLIQLFHLWQHTQIAVFEATSLAHLSPQYSAFSAS